MSSSLQGLQSLFLNEGLGVSSNHLVCVVEGVRKGNLYKYNFRLLEDLFEHQRVLSFI